MPTTKFYTLFMGVFSLIAQIVNNLYANYDNFSDPLFYIFLIGGFTVSVLRDYGKPNKKSQLNAYKVGVSFFFAVLISFAALIAYEDGILEHRIYMYGIVLFCAIFGHKIWYDKGDRLEESATKAIESVPQKIADKISDAADNVGEFFNPNSDDYD